MLPVLTIAGYTLLTFYQIIPLYKQKFWRDFWAGTIIGFFSFIIAVLLCFNINIPSPEKPIRVFITSIFGK